MQYVLLGMGGNSLCLIDDSIIIVAAPDGLLAILSCFHMLSFSMLNLVFGVKCVSEISVCCVRGGSFGIFISVMFQVIIFN